MRGLWGRLFLVALALGAAFSLTAISRLTFDHNSRSLLKEDPEADAREGQLVSSFGSEDLILVAWEVTSAVDPDEFARLRAVSGELGAIAGLEETYSLASDIVRLPLAGKLRPISPEDLATPEGRAAVREALLGAAPYLGTIYSEELDVVAVAGTLRPGSRGERERAVREVRAVARRHGTEERPLHVAGVTALAMDAGEYAVNDMKRIGAVALLVAVAVLLVLCRSLVETVIAIVATGLPPLFALACAVVLDVPVTALGAALFPVMAVVGITGSIHVLSGYGEARRNGVPAAEAPGLVARRLAGPIILSFVTTAAGFTTLQTTSVPAFRASGHVVALGLLFAIPVLLVGVPAALAWAKPVPRDRASPLPGSLRAVAAWAVRRRVAVATVSLLLCAAGAAALVRARLRVDVLQAFQPESRIARTYAFLESRLTATIPIDAVLEARAEAKPDAVLADLDRFAGRARAAGVQNAMSLATLVEFGRRVSPVAVDAPGAVLFLRTFFSPVTKRFEDVEHRRYRVKMRVRDGSPPEVLDALAAAARECETGTMELTGLYVRAVGTTRGLVNNLAKSGLLMGGVVLLTVALALRSWRLGVAAVVPNLLPPLVIFGAAVLLGVTLDISAVAVGAVSIGLAVDNTLHVAFRLAEERRKGVPLEEALQEAMRTVGRALVLATVVLAAGLGCLALSAFVPTARFGLFAGAAAVVALPGDLAVFPAFVRLLRAL
jgi:predicted RND superfamily exporter protein